MKLFFSLFRERTLVDPTLSREHLIVKPRTFATIVGFILCMCVVQ